MSNAVADVNRPSWVRRAWAGLTAGGWLLLFFTVVLPAIALLVEALTGMCAEVFFDPLPTPWHAVAVATVPVANLAVWLTARRAPPRCARTAALLSGLALALTACLAIPFLPLALLGLLVLVGSWWYFGFGLLGLLPMAPPLALIGGFFLRRRLLRACTGAPRGRLRGTRLGVLLGLLFMLLLLASDAVTLTGMHLAASADPQIQRRGVALLRRTARRDILLKACEWRGGPWQGLTGMLLPDAERLTTEQARTLFYRVTGEDYRLHGGDGWSPLAGRRGRRGGEALTWDSEQGGERVGGILKGLALFGSRYEERLEPAAGLAYTEWTLIFRNDFDSQREARARIALPPGSVVSRLTLWIDGEEREAAFGGRSQTRQAYERIVAQRRDPVLVASCGPDRIQVQCFPVPANGEMKLRLGLTVPLQILPDGREAMLTAPAIVERNFRLPADTLDLPATRKLRLDPPLAAAAWCRDTRGTPAGSVLQQAVLVDNWRPQRLALVVDGSAAMATRLPAVAAALTHLPAALDVRLWFVGDGPGAGAPLLLRTPLDEAAMKSVARLLAPGRCAGGRCNLRTLQAAWDDLGTVNGNGALVWVHGPQPYPSAAPDDLHRRLQRAPPSLRAFLAQAVPGTARIHEALDDVANIATLAPAETLRDAGETLGELFRSWRPGATGWECRRMRTDGGEQPANAVTVGDHLARIWAFAEVRRLLASGDPVRRAAAQQLALSWNLVTPVSSAVVLETQQQYQEAGLDPVSPSSVPTVPEPALWLSLLAAAAVLGWLRMRQRHGVRPPA